MPPKNHLKPQENLLQKALQFHRSGNLNKAEVIYQKILENNPNHHDALQLLGVIFAQRKDYEKGVDFLSRSINLYPKNPEVLNNRGNIYYHLEKKDLALLDYLSAVEIEKENLNALNWIWKIYFEFKDFENAFVFVNKYLLLKPNDFLTINDKGKILRQLCRLEEALECHQLAVKLNSLFAEGYHSLALVYQDLERPLETIENFNIALQIEPQNPSILNGFGNFFFKQKNFQLAIENYLKATSINQNFELGFYNMGIAYHELKDFINSESNYLRAVQINPKSPNNFNNLGNLYKDLYQYSKAVECYKKAIDLDPALAIAYNNLGVVYQKAYRDAKEALVNYSVARAIDQNYQDPLVNRADLYRNLKMYQESISDLDTLLDLNENSAYARGLRLHIKMFQGDWDGFEDEIQTISKMIEKNQKVASPFIAATLIDSLEIQKKGSITRVMDKEPENSVLGPILKKPKSQKIRIGYYSADFHNHATTYLMAELFELHDKEKFELYAFSFGPDIQDEMRKRVSNQFSQFYDVRNISDQEVAEISRVLEIDIAVDLKGHTTDSRLGIFSYRAAPIQVHYLGYPGTLGASYIDYLIADPIIIPESSQNGYVEKIVYLPNSYQVNDTKRKVSDLKITRNECGLPEDGFIYCNFNNGYKITPETFKIWMSILKSVDGSVIWLLDDSQVFKDNLRKEALNQGVDPSRLIFAKRESLPDHLARQKLADLFLDTWPCNAHTTCSDALWVGLPVLTKIGETFVARVASSLLKNIGLSELITSSNEDYQNLAIRLAKHPQDLKILKESLNSNRLQTPLFNINLFTQHFEIALIKMYENYHNNEIPKNIYVE